MKGILSTFLKGNPLASVTLSGLLTILGSYLIAHFDPSALTPTGVTVWAIVSAGIGVLTHHAATPVAPK